MDTIKFYKHDHELLPIHQGIPDKWSQYIIPAANCFHVNVPPGGIMLFQQIPSAHCDIWVSNYFFNQSTTVHCESKSQGVEFHNIIDGNLLFSLNGHPWQVLKAGEHNVLFNPEIRSTAVFNMSHVTTIDFHLPQHYFKELIQHQPAFRNWLHQMRQGQDLRLYPDTIKTPMQLKGLIAEMITRCEQSLDPSQHVLDVLNVSMQDNSTAIDSNCLYHYSFEDVKSIFRFREAIARTPYSSIDLPAMIRKSLMGYKKFVEGFKLLYGASPAQFLLSEKIKACKSLLLKEEKLTNEHIAAIMEFNSGSHFATTFKRFVHYTPSAYRDKFKSLVG